MEPIDKPKILIVDDKKENLLAMQLLFEAENCEAYLAQSGNEALGLMVTHDFAMVLLDVQMPEMDGFETAELMRSNNKTGNIPIIFVTAINKDRNHIFRGYETGAVDYIFKPVDPIILKSKTRVFLMLHNQQKKLEEANRKIVEQHKSVLEEERLKVLLEMAGATAHELNQPLMALLGSIELMGLCRNEPEEIEKSLERIKKSGKRISEVIRKIQNIRQYDVKDHDCLRQVINIDQVSHVLHVDPSDKDHEQLKELLAEEEYLALYKAKSIEEAMNMLRSKDVNYNMVFIEFLLGDGSGFDFLQQFDSEGFNLPVVIITNQRDEIIAAQLIQAGASEYLSKKRLSHGELTMVIQKAQTRQRLKMDILRMQDRLVETSVKDELTSVYNRRFFMETLESEFKRSSRYKRTLSLLLVDIDHFKSINDSFGHITGDEVLARIAQQISSCLRTGDIIGRYGGEEFGIILPETSMKGAVEVGEKMRELVSKMTFEKIQKRLVITISVGVATTVNEEDPIKMLETADKALYSAKNAGRNKVVL